MSFKVHEFWVSDKEKIGSVSVIVVSWTNEIIMQNRIWSMLILYLAEIYAFTWKVVNSQKK